MKALGVWFNCPQLQLTHWDRVAHIGVSRLDITGSDNGLSPGRRQGIIWTNAGKLLIWPLGTNLIEIFIEIYIFSFKKMHLKMPSGNWQPMLSLLQWVNCTHEFSRMIHPRAFFSGNTHDVYSWYQFEITNSILKPHFPAANGPPELMDKDKIR